MQLISQWTPYTTPEGWFRYGSVVGGQAPTPIKAEWLNAIQAELANFILAYLPALNGNDNEQLLKAARQMISGLASKATTLAGYGITDAYTKPEMDLFLSRKANWGITLADYGIGDAYTKAQADTLLLAKANWGTTLAAYGISDAYTKPQIDSLLSSKANWGITLGSYGIGEGCKPDSSISPFSMLFAGAAAQCDLNPAEGGTPDINNAHAAALGVLEERLRQIDDEGYTAERDDQYTRGQLADAAGAYAFWAYTCNMEHYKVTTVPPSWPWMPEHWKPTNQRQMLVRAGALILAEIARLDRQHTREVSA